MKPSSPSLRAKHRSLAALLLERLQAVDERDRVRVLGRQPLDYLARHLGRHCELRPGFRGDPGEILNDRVSVFAETAEMAEEIDEERARQALEKAKLIALDPIPTANDGASDVLDKSMVIGEMERR